MAIDKTWVGGSGSWLDPLKWTPQSTPQTLDAAYIVSHSTDSWNILLDDPSYSVRLASLDLAARGSGSVALDLRPRTMEIGELRTGANTFLRLATELLLDQAQIGGTLVVDPSASLIATRDWNLVEVTGQLDSHGRSEFIELEAAGGTIRQTDGTIQSIYTRASNGGILLIEGGQFSAGGTTLGTGASFVQTGGRSTHQRLGVYPGASLVLSSGVLENRDFCLLVDGPEPARFIVASGGHHISSQLDVASSAEYRLGGGTLTVQGWMQVRGTLSGVAGAASTIRGLSGSFVNLTDATLRDTGSVSLQMEGNTVVILPAAAPGTTQFTSIVSDGVVHTAGTELVIPTSFDLSMSGTVRDPLRVQGRVRLSANPLECEDGLHLEHGGVMSGGWPAYLSLRGSSTISGSLNTFHLQLHSGNVRQTDGLAETHLGMYHESGSLYELRGGRIMARDGLLLRDGSTLVQSGGQLDSLWSMAIEGSAEYRLEGGDAVTNLLELRSGNSDSLTSVKQTGGNHTTNTLLMHASSVYSLEGGVLSVVGSANISGTLRGTGTPAALLIGDGASANLSRAQIVDAHGITVFVDDNSLLIVPTGVNPSTAFHGVVGNGLIHVSGQPLFVPPPFRLKLAGNYDDPVRLAGTNDLGSSRWICNAGLTVDVTGAVSGTWPSELVLRSESHFSGDVTVSGIYQNLGCSLQDGGNVTAEGLTLSPASEWVIQSGSLEITSGGRLYGGSVLAVHGGSCRLASFHADGLIRVTGGGFYARLLQRLDALAEAVVEVAGGTMEVESLDQRRLLIGHDGDGAARVALRSNGVLDDVSVVDEMVMVNRDHSADLAVLDIGENGMIVDYPAGSGSPGPTLREQIRSAFDDGHWTGAGITSSVAASDSGRRVGVGFAEAVDLGTATFLGRAVDATAFLFRLTPYADTNLDGFVGFDDLLALAQAYDSPGLWHNGDSNYDGQVDFSDLLKIAQNYGSVLSAGGSVSGSHMDAADFVQEWARARSMVPEPALLSVSLLTVLAMGYRRRRSDQSAN